MTEASDFAKERFSTDDLPEQDRVTMGREHYGYKVLGVEIEPAEEALFQSSIVSRHLPGLNLVVGKLSAARVKRTREFVARWATTTSRSCELYGSGCHRVRRNARWCCASAICRALSEATK